MTESTDGNLLECQGCDVIIKENEFYFTNEDGKVFCKACNDEDWTK